jgi:hypothetical protein
VSVVLYPLKSRAPCCTVPLNFGFAFLYVFWLIKKHFDAEEER